MIQKVKRRIQEIFNKKNLPKDLNQSQKKTLLALFTYGVLEKMED